jgi:hypothetical protein
MDGGGDIGRSAMIRQGLLRAIVTIQNHTCDNLGAPMATKATTVTVVTKEIRSEAAAVLVRRTFRADNFGLVASSGSPGRLLVRAGRAPVAEFVDWSHAYVTDALVEEQQDELGELSQTQQQRLQMTMDRVSQFEHTLSNLMKKIAETDQSIVQNLK